MKTQIKKLVKSALFGVTVLGGAMFMQSFTESIPTVKQNEQMWGRLQNGAWVELNTPEEQSAPCNPDPEVCKAIYQQGFTPVTGAPSEPGHVSIVDEEGFIDLP